MENKIIYLKRDPIVVKAPKDLKGIGGEFTFTSVSSSNIPEPWIDFKGPGDQVDSQQRLAEEIAENIRSLEVLRCQGAIEVRIGSHECEVLAELDVMDLLTKQAADRTLANLFILAWTLKRDWPGASFRIRSEIQTKFSVKMKRRSYNRLSSRPRLQLA